MRAIISYTIKRDCKISDHFAMAILIKLKDTSKEQGCWKMNIRYLKDTSEQVKHIWKLMSGSNSSFFLKLKKVINLYKQNCHKKAKEFKAMEQNRRQELVVALLDLYYNPYLGRK